jgi:hypothetical protein
MSEDLGRLWAALAAWPLRHKVLALAGLVVVIELLFRRLAPGSAAYRGWTRFFEAIGHIWTAVLLGIVYFLPVSLVALGMRIVRHDPLDRSLQLEPSFWRAHEPNPLGPRAAARHQF